jgi:hypothetical protein
MDFLQFQQCVFWHQHYSTTYEIAKKEIITRPHTGLWDSWAVSQRLED